MPTRIKYGPIIRKSLTSHKVRKYGRICKNKPQNKDDKFGIVYLTSLMVLSEFLGKDWVERKIFSNGLSFLGDSKSNNRSILVMERTNELAEMLFNLQYVAGFSHVVERLKSADVEATFAELEAGRLFKTYKVDFNFNVPDNAAGGKNFDLNLRLRGVEIAADTKCKLETTKVSAGSILNSLKDSQKKQLPQGKPGILILRLPESWPLDEKTMDLVHFSVQKFFRFTTRVIAVLILRTRFEVIEKKIFNYPFFEEIVNPKQKYGRDLLPVSKEWPVFSHKWVRFTSLLGYSKSPNHFEVERIKMDILSAFNQRNQHTQK